MNRRKAHRKPERHTTRQTKARVSPAEQLTATELGERLGMVRQHVNRLAREGKLVRIPDARLFDVADPKNAAFIAEHAKPPVVLLPVPPALPVAGPIPEPTVSGLPRVEIERRKSLAQLEKLRLANEKAAGSLVERPSVFAFIGSLVAILNNQFLALPQRAAPDLAAIARGAESDDAAAVAVESFLSKDMYSSCRAASAIARKFLASMYDQASSAAGPLPIERALEDLRGMIDAVLAELATRKAAA
jgi:hypothetical protein